MLEETTPFTSSKWKSPLATGTGDVEVIRINDAGSVDHDNDIQKPSTVHIE